MPEIATLVTVGLATAMAGALNAVAGGGSFLTLPVLVWAGLPPVAANATGTAALLPGYLAGAWGFKDELPPTQSATALPLSWAALAALCAFGGAAGAGLLLATGNTLFAALVPWLLLAATALFAAAPWLQRRVRAGAPTRWHAARTVLVVLTVSAYGGFFNGGLGIVLLAALGLLGMTHLGAMNALKNAASALLTAIAVAVYVAGGVVHWPWALGLMACATAGGYLGARVARRIPPPWLRAGIVATGLVMALLMWP